MDDPRKAGDILVSLKMMDPGFKAATVMSMAVTGAEHATSSTTTTTTTVHHIDTMASAAVAAVQGCSNKCQFSHDGSCDDGGANSVQVRDVFRLPEA